MRALCCSFSVMLTSFPIAVTLAPGVVWNTVYREAQEHGVSVAGGWAVGGSVGAAAGWPLGGGHSVVSAFYGLGKISLSRWCSIRLTLLRRRR